MAKITSETRASQWSVKAEELIKNSTLAELKGFILKNGEVEEDPDEEGRIHDGKENLWGKTYMITAEGFHHDEFFITNEGRIFFLISLNHQVEIIEERKKTMKLEEAMMKRHDMENRLADLQNWLNEALDDDSVTDAEYDAVQKEVRKLQTELHDFSVDILAGKFDEDQDQQDETPAGMKLIKVDKNGSKHYEGLVTCPKCGGIGLIAHHVENGVPSWNWTDGGVCWKCLGTGKVQGKMIIRTPEYEAVLAERRQKKLDAKKQNLDQKKQEWLKKNGFSEDGFIWIILGETYSKKDQIKELGGHFNRIVGWYLDHEVEGFQFLKIYKDFILFDTYYGYEWKQDVDIKSMKEAEEAKPNPSCSEYQGQIKDRLKDLHLTVTFTTVFEQQMEKQGWNGRSYFKDDSRWFYSFKDDQGNIFTWTASLPAGMKTDAGGFRSLQKGDHCILTGTVKNHKEYKGNKQTVLTRCKVQGIA